MRTDTAGLLLVLIFFALPVFADPASPLPLRHYDFHKAGDAPQPFSSDTGPDGALTFDPGPGGQKWQVVPGRISGQKAVRLDQGALAGAAAPLTRAFTVEMWLRPNGPGVQQGNSDANNGMLAAAGNGYWDGWRLTVAYPNAAVGFEIGRPQPSSSVGISGGALARGAWQHIAASWDGKTMRLFVNGLSVASGPFDGVLTPAPSLRMGFAGSGVGSQRMDAGELTIYDQARDPLAIFEDANAPLPLPEKFRDGFRQALTARLNGDLTGAASAFRALSGQAALPLAYRAAARLGLADALPGPEQAAAYAALVEWAEAPVAVRQEARARLLPLLTAGSAGTLPPRAFEALLALPGIEAFQEIAVRRGYAAVLRVGGDYPAALTQYDRLLRLPLTRNGRWDAELARLQTIGAGGDLKAFRRGVENFAHRPGVPTYYAAFALLAAARSASAAGNYGPARAAYRDAAALPNLPPHLRREAQEGLGQVARLAAGKAAFDLAESRIRLAPESPPAAQFTVAPGGSDQNPGTAARPFATLQRAREAVRALRRNGILPRGGVRVTLRGGEYPVADSLALTAEDSGTAAAPVIYAAASGETPVLTGAVRLHGFSPVQDPALLARLPEAGRGHILQVDLKAAGVTDFGLVQPHGFGQKAVPLAELFWNGQPLTPARWPNTGFVLTGKVRKKGEGGLGMEFEYPGDRPAHWAAPSDAWLYGYWFWDWADGSAALSGVDPAAHTLHTAQSPPYGVRAGQRFCVYNVLEELDTPGEWYLDRTTGLLLFYPPAEMTGADVRFSVLSVPLMTLSGVSQVTLRGLTLEGGRGAGVTMTGGDHCLLAGCTVRRLGGDAVLIDGGTDHGVLGCDLYTLGRGGVRMTGGDRKTLTPGGHFVENCDIHDFSRLDRTYTPAVLIDGVGCRIAHCHFHDAPHSAIRLEGNDHVIEFNEVDHVVTEADDQGGFDEWYNASYRGNVLRDNFWHDIGSGLTAVGQSGIRLDDAISGTLIYQNVFLRCAGGNFGAVQMNGGKDNWIDNNLFVDCATAVSGGFWGANGWADFLKRPGTRQAFSETVDVRVPPYSVRYPELRHLEAADGLNYVWRNAVVGCARFLPGSQNFFDVANNFLVGQTSGLPLGASAPPPSLTGFAPLPLSEMGLYRDSNRASWPASAPAR